MNEWQVILKAGVEGGSITLNGIYNGKCWFFSRDVLDHTQALIDKPNLFRYSKSVYSWQDALEYVKRNSDFAYHASQRNPQVFLHASIVRDACLPASKTDLTWFVLASAAAFTWQTKIAPSHVTRPMLS